MTGTREGGLKAAEKNKKNNPNFYAEIGRKGGQNGHTGGFHANKELARTAGAKGGRKSKRRPSQRPGESDYMYQLRCGFKNWTAGDAMAVAESENG